MPLSDKIFAGMAEKIPPRSQLAQIARRKGVRRTADFLRIEELPRRRWEDAGDLEELRIKLTEWLRPEGGGCQLSIGFKPFELTKIQAAALRDIFEQRGALLPIAVGGGKAFISLLAPVVLDAKRPLLVVPADLREQTKRKVIPMLSRHFRLHPGLRVIGYSELSIARNKDLLETLAPDLIVFDECHNLRNRKAARTRRVTRYRSNHPGTVVVAMSGTISNRSIKDYAHILQWCLGVNRAPVPSSWPELCDWSSALDEGVLDGSRMAPGELETFCAPGETPREGYRRRLVETPGVIASGADELGVALRIKPFDVTPPKNVRRMLSELRRTQEDPNGDVLVDPSAVWRIGRQLALGFWYEWVPPPPPDWLEARRHWKRYVRDTLKTNRRGLDTELMVMNDVARAHGRPEIKGLRQLPKGKNETAAGRAARVEHNRLAKERHAFAVEQWRTGLDPNHCEMCAWLSVKPDFEIVTVPQWVDFWLVEAVRGWVEKGPGIVWVEHVAVGDRLSRDLGIPYFGSGKSASAEILDAEGPIIASIAAHGQGKNLQQWNRNLVTAPPSSGKTWEQLVGRTHRRGQCSDEVTVEVPVFDDILLDSLRKALDDARYLEETLGARQRLNYADITIDV